VAKINFNLRFSNWLRVFVRPFGISTSYSSLDGLRVSGGGKYEMEDDSFHFGSHNTRMLYLVRTLSGYSLSHRDLWVLVL